MKWTRLLEWVRPQFGSALDQKLGDLTTDKALRHGCKHSFSLAWWQQFQFSNYVRNGGQPEQAPGGHLRRQGGLWIARASPLFYLTAYELMKPFVHFNQRRSDLFVIRFGQGGKYDSIEPELTLMSRFILNDSFNRLFGKGAIGQYFVPHIRSGPKYVIDRCKKHRLFVGPQSIENVLTHIASAGQFRSRGSPVTVFAEDLADDRQQPFQLLIRLAGARH
jgi:hypothetical protein